MTFERGEGSLLNADVDALVNTVNTQGVMGKGLALEFKRAFPQNFAAYAQACRGGEVVTGRMHIFERLASPRYIINFPTKEHWRNPSKLSYVRDGLLDLVAQVRARNIKTLAIPPLGCGLGGLNWAEVKPLVTDAFERLPNVRAVLFEPTRAQQQHRLSGMTVLACGGRDYTQRADLFSTLDALHSRSPFACLIHGGAAGADRLAGEWAAARGIRVREFKADWNAHGRSAGPRRNQRMLDEGQPTLVVAFPGGHGTADMIIRANCAGLQVARVVGRDVTDPPVAQKRAERNRVGAPETAPTQFGR